MVPSPCRAAACVGLSVPAMKHPGPKPADPPPHSASASSDRPRAGPSADDALLDKPCAPSWQSSRLFQPVLTTHIAPPAPTPAPLAPPFASNSGAPVAKATSVVAETLEDSTMSSVSELRRKFENARSTPCLHAGAAKGGVDATSMFAPMPFERQHVGGSTTTAAIDRLLIGRVPPGGSERMTKSASAAGFIGAASVSSGFEATKLPSTVHTGPPSFQPKSEKSVKHLDSVEQSAKRPGQCEPKQKASNDFALAQAQSQPESPALLVTPRGSSTQKVRPKVPAFEQKPEPWMALRQIRLAPPLEEDNYAISDQDSDVEALESRDRSKKNIPKWCAHHTATVLGQADWDPDTIFGTKVPHCNLEDIFPDALYAQVSKQRPARKRGSSQDWKKDRLTRTDVNFYKTRMGQKKCWDEGAVAKGREGQGHEDGQR